MSNWALLSHNFKDIQAQLDNLVEESQKIGLKINISKIKDLRVNSNIIEALKIGDEAIETVDDFTYLGFKVTADRGELLDIEQRINNARDAFAKLKNVWSANNISLHLKIKLFIAT
jgi:hypothetical protein